MLLINFLVGEKLELNAPEDASKCFACVIKTFKNLDAPVQLVNSLLKLNYDKFRIYSDKFLPYLLEGSFPVSDSGMSADAAVFQKILEDPMFVASSNNVALKEDKVFQNPANKWNKRIAFKRDAAIHDENVSKRDDLPGQRNNSYKNVNQALELIISGLIKFRYRKLFFGIDTLYPSLYLLLLGSLMTGLVLFYHPVVAWILLLWIAIFGFNLVTSLYGAKADSKDKAEQFGVPIFIVSQGSSLLQKSEERNYFLVTEDRAMISIN